MGDGRFYRTKSPKCVKTYKSWHRGTIATPRRERSKSPEPKVTIQDPPMEKKNRQTRLN